METSEWALHFNVQYNVTYPITYSGLQFLRCILSLLSGSDELNRVDTT